MWINLCVFYGELTGGQKELTKMVLNSNSLASGFGIVAKCADQFFKHQALQTNETHATNSSPAATGSYKWVAIFLQSL